MPALAPATGRLTSEQRVAAASRTPHLFIEAEPGSGKTTVAAQRYGVLRYLAGLDPRAVVAVSFTRSATAELRARVVQAWGPSALRWPHCISTIDFLLRRLVRALLTEGQVAWPAGHTELEVVDDWRSIVTALAWTQTTSRVSLHDRQIVVRSENSTSRKPRPTLSDVKRHVGAGTCTHDDIRTVLADALERPELVKVIKEHLVASVRAIIVDEVFDANDLDLAVVELAIDAGIEVTIIGDPWQALYAFRGARPDLVPQTVQRRGIRRLPLTASFRWATEEQHQLATDLRGSTSLVLPSGDAADADVVLASRWGALWEIEPCILPIAFAPTSHNDEGRAAETLLLNQLTRTAFRIDAAYLGESLKVLGIADIETQQALEPALEAITLRLRTDDTADAIYRQLSDALHRLTGRPLRNPFVSDDQQRIESLSQRALSSEPLTPGMTIHQAKGREWNRVAVRLRPEEKEALKRGLDYRREQDRPVYVACTRARHQTFTV